MEERTPITFYQEIMLQKCFQQFTVPVDDLNLQGIVSNFNTQEELAKAVMEGGSLAFNALVEALKQNGTVLLALALKNHNILEKYRWVWVWSWEGEIMSRSSTWYDNEALCRMQAVGKAPGWDSFDGPGSPYPILCIESICECYEHLPPGHPLPREPCACFDKVDEQKITMATCNCPNSHVIYLPSLKN
jgi:hypothetical protein